MPDRKAATEAALAAHKDLLSDLEKQVLNFRTTPEWDQLLKWQASMPSRSMNNNILIQLQRPGSTLCRGYRDWQKHGRQVKQGESGLAIWAPITTRVKDENEQADVTYTFVTRFKTTYVFDISQTDVFDEELDQLNQSPQPILDGDAPLFETLLSLSDSHGITVTRTNNIDAEGQAIWNRTTGEREIRLRDDRPEAHSSIVMLHELAHVFMHQQVKEKISVEQKEWEAESVAYIVATHFELPTFADLYLATWQVQEGDLTKLLSRISKTSTTLIDRINAQALSAMSSPAIAA